MSLTINEPGYITGPAISVFNVKRLYQHVVVRRTCERCFLTLLLEGVQGKLDRIEPPQPVDADVAELRRMFALESGDK
jgi:hypothetical protein